MGDNEKIDNKKNGDVKPIDVDTAVDRPEDENARKANSSQQDKDSISSWFSIGALGASLTGKASKDNNKGNVSESAPFWGSSWLQSAKAKTFDTLESMKKDINEFTDTVQHEACSIANVAASSVKNQAQFIQQQLSQQLSTGSDSAKEVESAPNTPKISEDKTVESASSTTAPTTKIAEDDTFFAPSKWVSSFVESVQKLGMEDATRDGPDLTDEIQFSNTPLTRKTNLDQYQLVQIQNYESTYLQQPTQNVDLYRKWLAESRIMEYNGEINVLLGCNPKLREIYSKLVPSQVDNFTFWNRYFFKVYLQELKKEIAQRSAAKSKDADNNNGSGERDETWSLCSNDSQDFDDEVTALDTANHDDSDDNGVCYSRDEMKTPQLEKNDNEDVVKDVVSINEAYI